MTPSRRRGFLPPGILPLLFLPLLSSCSKPTFEAGRLSASVREICRKEYGFDASARLSGKTLYADIAPQNLIDADLGLNRKTVERLYDTLLTVTRVTLSSNAEVDFLVVRSEDADTGSVITILRYVPDIKWYFYMRISRADFEGRGVMEIDRAPKAKEGETREKDFHDIPKTEFMARLAASKLQQKITYNPLVSVFVRVHRITGSFQDGVMTLRMDKTQRLIADSTEEEGDGDRVEEAPVSPEDAFLKDRFIKVAGDVLNRYDDEEVVREVRVVESDGKVVFDFTRRELLTARKNLPKTKGLAPDEDY